MLRTLSTVGWVTRSANGNYRTTFGVAVVAACDTLARLCADVYGEAEEAVHAVAIDSTSADAWGRHLPRLARHLQSIESGWTLPGEASTIPLLPTMLAGAVITPLLLELRMLSSSYTAKAHEGKHEHASANVSLTSVTDDVANMVGTFFAFQQWGTYASSTKMLTLNDAGLFIVERCPAFGVCLSYRPMLHKLSDATYGETSAVFTYDGGHEAWVDRKLNVIGSGFMHNRYFSDMMRVHVAAIFNAEPLADQPAVVADMGCGDGTLLKTVYIYVRDHTLRGKHLSQYPLTMCGVDFNTASEEETARTLSAADVPHGTMFGDIGDPVPMQAHLERKFGVRRDQVLHVRSFLDHDRPFIAPTKETTEALEIAVDRSSDAAYVDNSSGALVTPAAAFFSLVDHWDRWAQCLGKHGLLVLEVSNLDVVSTRKYMAEATSMHFDCVQAHSGQMLMPATHFSLGAATAGLLPATGRTLTYPKDSPYTRIVLQQLRPAGVSIRIATLADMPALIALEAHWKSDVLSSDEATLAKRLAAHPTGQLVVAASDGTLLAAMYTQRVASYQTLLTAKRGTELSLHVDDGPVIQLLGVVQSPQSGAYIAASGEKRSAGQLLRDYVLHLGKLEPTVTLACGVTRCRAFDANSGRSYAEHVQICDDPGLLFHREAGAAIGELVHDYRPRDVENRGIGVMITYELHGGKPLGTGANTKASGRPTVTPKPTLTAEARTTAKAMAVPQTLAAVEVILCDAISSLSYSDETRHWTLDMKRKSFMELGLDSLDAGKFVSNLSVTFEPMCGIEISNTIMFEQPCVRDLANHLLTELKARNLIGDKAGAAAAPTKPTSPRSTTAGHYELAPPSDDNFYKRHEVIPYWMLDDTARKLGVPEELVRVWVVQRQSRTTVVTMDMILAAREEMESECFV